MSGVSRKNGIAREDDAVFLCADALRALRADAPDDRRRFRRRIARVAEGLDDRAVGVEIHLPVGVVVGVRTHREQRTFGRERENLDVGRGFLRDVRDFREGRAQPVGGIDGIDAVGDLRGQLDAAHGRRAVVRDGVREDLVVADDVDHVVRRDDGRAEDAQLLDGAGHAARRHEVADLERTQHLHEHARREMREQAAPRGADGEAETGKQRRERGGLHAEHLQDREHQQQVEHAGENRAEVVRERGVDAFVAAEQFAQEAGDQVDDPAPDDPQHDRRQHLGPEVDASGHDEYADGFEIQDALA
ncbi:hypothetical protein PT2222_270126 [Paraburkholderia tropica]